MPAWATSHVTTAMCRGSKMHLVATGDMAVAYERAYAVLMDTRILEKVAAAYLRDLPAGTKTNLVITPAGTNGLYLVDWQDERADVHDIWRNTDADRFFEGGFLIAGRRPFGKFESVMNLRVMRTDAGQARFQADVFIYPHNGLVRFVFKNLFSVERYFRDTMVDMSAELKRVCTTLCQAPTLQQPSQPPHPRPTP